MKKSLFIIGLLALAFVLPAASQAGFVDIQYVFQIGDTRTGPVTLSWNHVYDGSAAPEFAASLAILAEGIDYSSPSDQENDQVYFNGHFLGELKNQGFYYAGYDIQAGAGALGPPKTALTTSVFNLTPSWINVGNNLVEVVVDPGRWIMEAEVSTLAICSIPIPGAVWLLGSGLLGLAAWRRRS